MLREGLEKFPDAPELLERLAYLEYTHLKQWPDAYVHFHHLLQLKPDHARAAEFQKVIDYLGPRLGGPAAAPVGPTPVK